MVTEWPLLPAWLMGRDQPSVRKRQNSMLGHGDAAARTQDVEDKVRREERRRSWPVGPVLTSNVRMGRGL